MPTLSSLAAPEVVIMTTSGATNDDKVGIMITVISEWSFYEPIIQGQLCGCGENREAQH